MASSQYSSDRFPKVSIGIRVEKCQKAGSEQSKKDETILPTTTQQRNSLQRNFLRETSISRIGLKPSTMKSRDQSATAKSSKTTECLATPRDAHVLPEESPVPNTNKDLFGGYQAYENEKASPWLSTKPKAHEAQNANKFQFFVKQASIKELQDGLRKDVDNISLRKRSENLLDDERAGEIQFTAFQQTHALDKCIGREQHDAGIKHDNEALRKKLWEILGTGSQSKQILTSPALEETDVPKMKQREDNQGEEVVKAKPNSDTIETDSESPNPITQRPTTRSLTRKKNSTISGKKIQTATTSGKLPLSSSRSASKLKLEENIFAFSEVEAKGKRLSEHVNDHPNRFKGKNTELKNARIEPRRINFPVKFNSEKTRQLNGSHQQVSSPENEPRSQEMEPTPHLPVVLEDNIKMPSNATNISKNIHQDDNRQTACSSPPNSEIHKYSDSQKRKMNTGDFMTQAPKETYLPNGVTTTSVENMATPSADFNSPTFAVNASTPSTRNKLLDDDIPTPEIKRTCASEESYKPETDTPNTEADSSIATGDTHGLQESGLPYDVEFKETEKQPSLSPKEDEEFMSFKENNFYTKGYKPSDEWFSDAGNLEQTAVKFYRRKRTHRLKSKKISNGNLSSPSPIGTSKAVQTIRATEKLEQFPEDSMERAVYQLALILKKFKSKMKTQVSKKISAILSSAAEKVHLQLQDAESQIEANLNNFINTDQNKRKRLESKIQEQQKRSKLMYDKFKEEVNQNLAGFRSILDEFEAYHIELKGSTDKQKMSHKKLLLHVENSIETQLNDAEREVEELNKDANRKMKHLKGVVKEWMAGCTTN